MNRLKTPTLTDIETLQDPFFFYLKNEQDLSDETLRSYMGSIKVFLSWWKDRGNPEISKPLMGTYSSYLKQKGLSPGTRKLYISSLRRFFSFLIREDHLSFDPLYDIKVKKDSSVHTRDDLSLSQVRTLLGTIKDTPAKTENAKLSKLRDYAMIYLMLKTGIREIEVQRANIGDLRTKEGYHILDLQRKGRKEKKGFVVLREEVYSSIMDYINLRPQREKTLSSPLFSSIKRKKKVSGRLTTRSIRGIASKYLRLSGIKTPRITVHSLRHTAANMALSKAKGDTRRVQRMLDHKHQSTTDIYLHDKRTVEQAIELKIDQF